MRTQITLTLTAMLLLSSAVATAADSVYLRGEKITKKSGSISTMSPAEVGLAGKQPFSADEVYYIRYDSEPRELYSARKAALTGKYTTAIKAISRLKKSGLSNIKRPEMRADVAFYDGYSYAQYAFALSGSKQGKYLKSAEKRLNAFVSTSGKKNFHLFEAQALLGDVLVAIGEANKDAATFEKARAQYAAVAKSAPWPARKLEMSMKMARAYQAEGNNGQAARLFAEIENSNLEGEGVDSFKRQAQLGRANAMAANGNAGAAIEMVNQVILGTDPKEHEVLANAYLVMGRCARAGGNPKQELMAYLHIDMLYPQDRKIHEEALGRLAVLWTDANQPKRASDAQLKLRSQYPNSTWLKK